MQSKRQSRGNSLPLHFCSFQLLVWSVTQSCPTLCNSPPGSSVHGISQAKILELSCHFLLQRIFPTQGSNPRTIEPLNSYISCTGGHILTSLMTGNCFHCTVRCWWQHLFLRLAMRIKMDKVIHTHVYIPKDMALSIVSAQEMLLYLHSFIKQSERRQPGVSQSVAKLGLCQTFALWGKKIFVGEKL